MLQCKRGGESMNWPKRNKYKAQRTNGFPSKLESALNDLLMLKERGGEISELKRQQTVVLQEGTKGRAGTRIAWKVDFSFIETLTGLTAYAEAKGIETNDYLLKLKLWRANPPAKLYIFKGTYKRLKVTEVIEPNTAKESA